MLSDSQHLVVGLKQSKKAIESDQAKRVYIALDAQENISAPIIKVCKEKKIPVTYVKTMQELGALCAIDVGAAVAVLTTV